jgi:hypothetical protein
MSRRLVLCGSMSAYAEIVRTATKLQGWDIPCVLPEPEDDRHAGMSAAAFEEFKRRASRNYLNQIRRPETGAILVVNIAKQGIPDYIGANTFAEIAMAFQARKRIFVLHDLHGPYLDELLAWRAVPLRGNLEPVVRTMARDSRQMCLDFAAAQARIAA